MSTVSSSGSKHAEQLRRDEIPVWRKNLQQPRQNAGLGDGLDSQTTGRAMMAARRPLSAAETVMAENSENGMAEGERN